VNGNSKRLLIIDDDDLIALGLRDYLELHGFQVDTAHDYESAKTFVGGRHYSMALVDIVVTGHDAEIGMSFLRWLRENSPATTPVVLTGYRTAWLEHFALSLGITFVFDKPKSFEEIADLISTVLSEREHIPGETRI
jgi:DNA-binding response OmpR family regulator